MRRRKVTAGPVQPDPRLLDPYVEAFVDPADYATPEEAREAAHEMWQALCHEHNSRRGDVIRTPILNDYRYNNPSDIPLYGGESTSPWPSAGEVRSWGVR